MKDLVSIISPCYNGAKYIKPFLDSVLNQIYDSVELILVDDGSVDETRSVVESYYELFDKRGFSLIYLYQENKGQAAAINLGIPHIKGKYVMWVDSDDILLPNNISEKVEFLEQNSDCGFVFSQVEIVNSSDIGVATGYIKRDKSKDEDYYFEDLIHRRNVVIVPGAFLVRTDCFNEVIPKEGIFESREGQNWQLLLPLAYSYKYGYIEHPLFKYVVHDNSHYHKKRGFLDLIKRQDNMELLLKETIKSMSHMPENEKAFWSNEIEIVCLKTKFKHSLEFFKISEYHDYKKSLIQRGEKVDFTNHPIIYKVDQFFRKIKTAVSLVKGKIKND